MAFKLLILIIIVINVYLLKSGETLAVSVGSIVALLLLPSVLLSTRSKFLGIKVFTIAFFVTQFIGVPVFILNRGRYEYSGWNAVLNFKFTIQEFSQIYLTVGLLLFLTNVIFLFIEKSLYKHTFKKKLRQSSSLVEDNSSQKKLKYTINIGTLIALVTPINMLMFFNRIGLVGVETAELPYRMSGILVYMTRYIIPMIVFYYYGKSSRSLWDTLLVLSYALILGCSQISRTTTMMGIFPVVLYSIIDSKFNLLTLSFFWTLFSMQVATILRDYIYGSTANFELIYLLSDIFTSGQLLNINFLDIFFTMLTRIEAPQSLVLASQFDPEVLGGRWMIFFRMLYEDLYKVDADFWHINWIGVALPEGFGATGSTIATTVMICYSNWAFMVPIALALSVYSLVGDLIVQNLARQYNFQSLYFIGSTMYAVLMLIGFGNRVFYGFITILVITTLTTKKSFSGQSDVL